MSVHAERRNVTSRYNFSVNIFSKLIASPFKKGDAGQVRLSETTSLVILESLFAGVPVVCSDFSKVYFEIEKGFAPFSYFSKFSVKDYVKRSEYGKPDFPVSEESVDIIVNSLITYIANFTPFNRHEKETLSMGLRKPTFK